MKNWGAWNLSLWSDNDEGYYQRKLGLIRALDGPVTPEDAEKIARQLFPNGTPDMDDPDDMNKVDWTEVAEDFESDRKWMEAES